MKVGLVGLEKRVVEVALYSIALREAKFKWADGTSDDSRYYFGLCVYQFSQGSSHCSSHRRKISSVICSFFLSISALDAQ